MLKLRTLRQTKRVMAATLLTGWVVGGVLGAAGCSKDVEVSVAEAKSHVRQLVQTATRDVEEVRKGLPQGAEHLEDLYQREQPPEANPQRVHEALKKARSEVQDLRVAKSTFFALTTPEGTVIRNNREQDRMAGKNLLKSFPKLEKAVDGQYVQTRGAMAEASEVDGRKDAQWVAAQPIRVDGRVAGLYVTGWSWSAYAYRLENSIRGEVQSAIAESDERKKMPLLYVYVVTDDGVYGAPMSPEVNAEAIAKADALAHAEADRVFARELEITGREFGLAVQRAEALGPKIAIAVLRSET